MNNVSVEEFRDIPGYPGYSASNLGRIHSSKRGILKGTRPNGHYRRVTLRVNGKSVAARIHVLVAKAWLVKPTGPGRWTINHKNHDKEDCRLENLEWVTAKANTRAAMAVGRHFVCNGPTECLLLDTRTGELTQHRSLNRASKFASVSGQLVWLAATGVIKQAGPYKVFTIASLANQARQMLGIEVAS